MQHLLIDGEWVATGEAAPDVNPSDTRDVIADYARGGAAEVDAAVTAARRALPGWADATPQQRADLLEAVAAELLARRDEIGDLLAREEGKTRAEGVAETVRAGQIFRFFGGEALRVPGEALRSVRPEVDVEVTREPVGVVGIITPWNFPIAIPAWKVAPALAFGNTVVLKPADLTPACAHVLADVLQSCGCPPGVFNLVMGRGSVVGDALTGHRDVDAVSFTGSVPVGEALIRRCAEQRKKVQCEMGGKNPMVILDDADLDVAVPACINAAFHSTGQRCTAASRLIVTQGIHDAFVERLLDAMAALKVGDARAPGTDIGPVVSAAQLQSNLDYVRLAAEEGAEVVGGDALEGPTPGFYQRPAAFLAADNAMRIAREEIFGPCASVIRVADFDEALAVANDTEFGLSAGICTGSLRHAREFKRRAQAGMVMINLPTAGVDYHVPFGGRKGSSHGPREQGRHAVEFYTTVKTTYSFAP